MTYNSEELCRKAHELALAHAPTALRTQPAYIRKKFNEDIESLRAFAASLQDGQAGCTQPAEEWLLDNVEFIEEQAQEVRKQLSSRSQAYLPQLGKNGRLRIQALCENYLEQVSGVISEESLVTYVNAYQEISTLTHAETCSIPLILRVALIGTIADTMVLVRERREVCMEVEKLLSRIEPSRMNPEAINAQLDAAGLSVPLSGPWIVHLISHLREWAGDTASVREWLACKFENGSEDLDRIVSYEHQLQASYQLTTGHLIGSLRNNERREWNTLFERISLLDRTLRDGNTGDYPLLDTSSRNEILYRVEVLAHRMRVPESLVASQAIMLAKGEQNALFTAEDRVTAIDGSTAASQLLPRSAFLAYYLFEPAGVKKLFQSLRHCSEPRSMPRISVERRAGNAYFASLIGLFVLVFIAAAVWVSHGQAITPAGWIAVVLVLLLPVSEWALIGVHFGIERLCRPRPLLRYDFSRGIAPSAATMVVIPAIWSSVEELGELADRLEIHYLASRDPNIHYALLGDFADAAEEKLVEDEALVAYAKDRIAALNRMYAVEGGTSFHFYQRSRQWNASEGVFMGWERKRGKLVEFIELIKGRADTSFAFQSGEPADLSHIRYIITLDADTQLPMGSAQRMIGAMHLPYNRPRLNKSRTRVVEGYGVMQPRIGISHESAMRSRLAYFLSEPGMDPYAFAASDPYQDALQQGIFTGKGIFDVDVFAELLCERIPENTVLSHDLLEGGFLRAALLSDVELIDDYPSTFIAYQKRMHRWVRGDWQLLCWLFTHVCDRRGALRPVDLSFITRWKMIDNLRRSLLPIAYFVLIVLALTVLPGSAGSWLAVVFITMLVPVWRQLLVTQSVHFQPRRLLSTAVHILIDIVTLPFQTAVLAEAIGKTLYRLWISKRHLLEWTSSSHVERSSGGTSRRPAMLNTAGGYTLIVLFAIAALLQGQTSLMWIGLAFCLLWAMAPLFIRFLDRPVAQAEQPLTAADKEQLQGLAEQIWAFYEDYAGPKDNYLPPDNVQIDPPGGVAHRTSPTNIGFLLTACLAAREFGFINTPELIERLERTLGTIERMDKWNGHLYNWYDTVTLQLLQPAYVSTVDSGNFVASLMTVKQGLARWLSSDFSMGMDSLSPAGMRAGLSVEFAVELDKMPPGPNTPPYWNNEGEDASDIEETDGNGTVPKFSNPAPSAWFMRGQQLINRLESLIVSTDFRPLYDDKAKLFVLGFHASSGVRDTILYDLLASEARQTSFVAIALGQISVSHWLALGRTVKKQGSLTTLISWSGTMFEYMMPWLIMRTHRNSIWDSTYRGVVKRQIEYGRERGVPYGISESGYYAFDYQMNYQYRAFGVPGLGFKRGLEEDLVISPYATIMSLPFAVRDGLSNLLRMEKLGARGQYGFYEAIDYTLSRMPEGETCKVIRSFMAHHQGMSLLTLANMLLPTKMYDYFHQDKRVRAAELLLIERIPQIDSLARRELHYKAQLQQPKPAKLYPLREFGAEATPVPEVNVHSNGALTSIVSSSGSGFLRYNGINLSRWREDPIVDQWGSYMYIRDVATDQLWSPTYQPCGVSSAKLSVHFWQERTSYLREDEELQSMLDITVSADSNAEVRRLKLSNRGAEARILEVTTFLELALAAPDADKAHPAFTKLFVQTEYDAEDECLLARKRPRNSGDQSIWAFHTLSAGGQALGPVEFETDRASFIGRGHTLAKPKGIAARLAGTVGSVADPAFVMRRSIRIEPGEMIILVAVTGVADSKEQAVDIIRQLSQEQQADRAFQLAWTRSQIELQHLHITAADVAVFQSLAGRALYSAPLRTERKASIKANIKGQQGLWPHGISGDRPILIARIEDAANLSFVNKLLLGYEYLRHNGLQIDLVILNESPGGYQQDLREALLRMTEQIVGGQGAGRGGVHILPAVSEEDRNLLYAVSRLVLRADGPSLKVQLQVPDPVDSVGYHYSQMLLAESPSAERYSEVKLPEMNDTLFFNGWGGFSQDGKEYQVILKNGNYLPAPWINVMANPTFGCLASELNTGYTWWRNSRECKLTPWSNDPALDQPGEVCYLRDEASGEYWQLAPNRTSDNRTYRIAHGRGYTRYEHESHGLQQEMTVYVPLEDPVKLIQLQLHNTTEEPRTLSVTYYAEWVLGVHREGSSSFIVTEWDEEHGMLMARNTYQENFRDATAFLAVYTQAEEAAGGRTWTGDRLEFIGRKGTVADPAAMSRIDLSGAVGASYDSCGAVQVKLVIEPGAEQVVYILLGCEHSTESAAKLAQKYREPAACKQAYEDVEAFWDDVLGTITVSTPSPEMDLMLNNWLLYQTLACRMWARSAFYQAGGAYGFRDQLQDSLAMLHSRPEMTRAQIILHASHQYEEGDVQHWWHEETGRGIRTRFSDDLLWLPYAVLRYLEHTEDDTLLSELAPYLHSELLGEEEHERYEVTVMSGQSGTILEHCFRAIDRSLRFGEHGLPLIGIGDWNDGMSLIGPEGRGESVWLGWFLGDVLRGFTRLCENRGEHQRAARYREALGELTTALNGEGWDGQWFRRAFTDSGQWLGSVRSPECRIDSIAQSWSVISGMAEPGKAQQAMRSFDRELVNRSLGIAHILTPPFDKTDPSPGYIQGYPPGIRENGGQYTHGVIWSIIAWCGLGDGDKAFELFHMFNPISHTKTAAEVRKYVGEPYAMAADVYSEEPHPGHAGWTWYTGASGWMYQSGIEWILGLRRHGERLLIRPCIPPEWPGFSAIYRYGSTEYRIAVDNPARKSSGQTRLMIDGQEAVEGSARDEEGLFVLLVDDRQVHQIVLTM